MCISIKGSPDNTVGMFMVLSNSYFRAGCTVDYAKAVLVMLNAYSDGPVMQAAHAAGQANDVV